MDGKLLIDGDNSKAVLDAKTGQVLREKLDRPASPERPKISGAKGNVTSWSQHGDILVAGTTEGVFGFSTKPTNEAATHRLARDDHQSAAAQADQKVDSLLEKAKVTDGYALLVGLRDAEMVQALFEKSTLHVVVQEQDQKTVEDMRRQLDDLQSTIIASGYQFWGEYGLAGRRYLTKGTDPRTHNIHSFESGNAELHRHLAFRDYLRAHPDVAADYERLKRRVAIECNHDIDKYCEGKDPFIKHHQQLALKYISTRS